MKKSENTRLQIEAALQRILDGKTNRIPEHRKLSVRAVEEEAGLGNGSCYYYQDITRRIQSEINRLRTSYPGSATPSDISSLKTKRDHERRIKIQYRKKVEELTRILASMAAEHHQLSWALKNALAHIEKLEKDITELKNSNIFKL